MRAHPLPACRVVYSVSRHRDAPENLGAHQESLGHQRVGLMARKEQTIRLLNLCVRDLLEFFNQEPNVIFGMCCRNLYANAGLALRNNRERKSNHKDTFVE